MTLLKRSLLFITIALVLLTISIFLFYHEISDLIPLGIVSIVNVYLVIMLFVAAIVSDSPNPIQHAQKLNIYANRVSSLILMMLFFGIFIFCFASLYNHAIWTKYPFPAINSFDCIYSSFITLTTLSVDSVDPDTVYLKKIVVFEVFSSLNLLIGAVSFLLSRLSNF